MLLVSSDDFSEKSESDLPNLMVQLDDMEGQLMFIIIILLLVLF
jgi:hypothetical protein